MAIAVATLFLVRNLDALVEAAIEKYGSQATGTRVRVASVEIELSDGRGTIRGFTVANPDGFTSDHAFAWDGIVLELDPGRVASAPHVLESVLVTAPEVVLEWNERGESNLEVLRDRLTKRRGAEPTSAGRAEPRLRIRRFAFEGGALEVRTPGKNLRAAIPPFGMQDLGGRDGATAGEIGRAVMLAYAEQALRTAARRELGRQAEKLIEEELVGPDADAVKSLLNRVLER